MIEFWKPVVNYEGRYEVSNLGKVRSLNFQKSGRIKELTLVMNRPDGYNFIRLGSELRDRSVARLVLETFEGLKPGFIVDHRDRVRTNDVLTNLRWVTSSENKLNSECTLHSSSGGVIGVSWYPQSSRWRAQTRIHGKQWHVGYFNKIEDAIEAIFKFKEKASEKDFRF